jgi:hypothetical protein
VAVGASVALVVAAFLPWVRSGTVDRDLYAAIRSARRLGLADSAFRRAALSAYAFVPLAVAAAWLLAALGRARPAAVVAMASGAVAVAAGVVAVRAPIVTGPGPVASIVAGAVAVAGGSWLAYEGGRRTNGG